MESLERVQLELEFVKELLVQGYGVAQWEAFCDTRTPENYDEQQLEFLTYAKMRSNFAAVGNYDYFGAAREALVRLYGFGFSDEIPKQFGYQTIETSNPLAGPEKNLREWRETYYVPVVKFVLDE